MSHSVYVPSSMVCFKRADHKHVTKMSSYSIQGLFAAILLDLGSCSDYTDEVSKLLYNCQRETKSDTRRESSIVR